LKEEALGRTMWRNRFGRGFGPVVWQITDDDDDDACPSVRMEQLGSHWTDFNKIWYLTIFLKSV